MYICPKCGTEHEDVRAITADEPEFECADCSVEMRRNFQEELPVIHDDHYSRPIVSDSLAIHPDQIAEHKKLFPDIKVQGDGRIVFDKYSTHNTYLEKRGLVKYEQKKSKNGNVIRRVKT